MHPPHSGSEAHQNNVVLRKSPYTAFTLSATMSLVTGYSSDEDAGPVSPMTDAFGLSKLPVVKKPRVDEPSSSLVVQAAPDVLSEVRINIITIQLNDDLCAATLGPIKPNVPRDASYGHSDECEHLLR